MKQTKKIGKILTLTVLTLVVLFYLLPNVAFIEQSLEIKATPDKVFGLINRPKNWAEWYTPLLDTSGVQIQLLGTSEGKGAGMKWNGVRPKPSTGMMNIRNSKNNRNVTVDVTINDRRTEVMNFKIRPVGTDASMLTVTSRLRFRQDSLLHYLRLMFDRSDELAVIDYLENIDAIAIQKTGGIDVYLQRTDPFSYLSLIDSSAREDVSQLMKNAYHELLVFGAKLGVNMTARPIAVYHKRNNKQIVVEMGIPTRENVPTSGRIQLKTMPGGNHVIANFYGAYDTLEDAHNAIQQWLMRYRRKATGNSWELFVTDPAVEPDPNKWLTQVHYPVR